MIEKDPETFLSQIYHPEDVEYYEVEKMKICGQLRLYVIPFRRPNPQTKYRVITGDYLFWNFENGEEKDIDGFIEKILQKMRSENLKVSLVQKKNFYDIKRSG